MLYLTDMDLIEKSKKGDVNAFHNVFKQLNEPLKSYIYRLVTDRNDMEDVMQETFIKAFDKIATLKDHSSFKSWVFTIATRITIDAQKRNRRWQSSILDDAKEIAALNKDIRDYLKNISLESRFDLKEHIDFCFTCISKTLPIEQQVSLLLKDIYEFKVKEIANILNKGEAAVKHYIRLARKSMTEIFDHRCALVNKKGMCHQCSELNHWLNPKQNTQAELIRLEIYNQKKSKDKKSLFKIREHLIKEMNPLKSEGANIREAFFQLHRIAAGEANNIE